MAFGAGVDMARMDAFSAQIVKFVREMPDEALLDLVKQKLGVLGVSAGRRGGRIVPVSLAVAPSRGRARGQVRGQADGAKGARSAAKRSRARPRRAAPPSAERQSLLDSVERVVKASSGVSASDVARLASIPQTRAAAALKELKLAKRIFQGGDRRFARYAGDSKTAEQASTSARKTAKGPVVRSPKHGVRPRKRAQALASAPAS
jgi:hypothetical protein